MKKLIFCITLFAAFVSCDNKQKREQALKDLYIKQQQYNDVKKEIENTESELTNMIGELEVAKDNINRVKEFHLLRFQSEREQEIRNATTYKIEVEKNIENLKMKIILLNDSVTQTSKRIATLEDILKN